MNNNPKQLLCLALWSLQYIGYGMQRIVRLKPKKILNKNEQKQKQFSVDGSGGLHFQFHSKGMMHTIKKIFFSPVWKPDIRSVKLVVGFSPATRFDNKLVTDT